MRCSAGLGRGPIAEVLARSGGHRLCPPSDEIDRDQAADLGFGCSHHAACLCVILRRFRQDSLIPLERVRMHVYRANALPRKGSSVQDLLFQDGVSKQVS